MDRKQFESFISAYIRGNCPIAYADRPGFGSESVNIFVDSDNLSTTKSYSTEHFVSGMSEDDAAFFLKNCSDSPLSSDFSIFKNDGQKWKEIWARFCSDDNPVFREIVNDLTDDYMIRG